MVNIFDVSDDVNAGIMASIFNPIDPTWRKRTRNNNGIREVWYTKAGHDPIWVKRRRVDPTTGQVTIVYGDAPLGRKHIAFGPLSAHSNLMGFKPISFFLQDENNIVIISEDGGNDNIAIDRNQLRYMLDDPANLYYLCRKSAQEYNADPVHPFNAHNNPRWEHVYSNNPSDEYLLDTTRYPHEPHFFHKPTTFFSLGRINPTLKNVMIPKRILIEAINSGPNSLFLTTRDRYPRYKGNNFSNTMRDMDYFGVTEGDENRFARYDTILLGEAGRHGGDDVINFTGRRGSDGVIYESDDDSDGEPRQRYQLVRREANRCTTGGNMRTLEKLNTTRGYLLTVGNKRRLIHTTLYGLGAGGGAGDGAGGVVDLTTQKRRRNSRGKSKSSRSKKRKRRGSKREKRKRSA